MAYASGAGGVPRQDEDLAEAGEPWPPAREKDSRRRRVLLLVAGLMALPLLAFFVLGRERAPTTVWDEYDKLTAAGNTTKEGDIDEELLGGLLAPGVPEPVPGGTVLEALPVRAVAAPPAEAARLRGAPQEVRPRHAALRRGRRAAPVRPQRRRRGVQVRRLAPPRQPRQRLVSGPGFRRQFREFHHMPPMLGAIVDNDDNVGFVSTSSYHYQAPDELRDWCVLDAHHGRVLFSSHPPWDKPWPPHLSVWDPITNEQLRLPRLRQDPPEWSSNFAVLCTANGCNHLDCGHGPFIVVVKAVGSTVMYTLVYLYEDGEWSAHTFAQHINEIVGRVDDLDLVPGAVVGDAIYVLFCKTDGVLKFDLATREMVVIHLPRTNYPRHIALITTENGGLGFAGTKERTLYLWLMVAGPNEEARWAQSRVIQLETILPVAALSEKPTMLCSVGVIFLLTTDGVYRLDLKSSQARKMPNELCEANYVVPFLSLCTPAMAPASVYEELRGSTSSA